MKKLIVYFIIFSVISFTGCYYYEQMNPNNYDFKEKINIKITLMDTVYNFRMEDHYYLDRDTLIRAGVIENTKEIKQVKIPVNDIEKLEIQKIDLLNTALLATGIRVIILIVAAASINPVSGIQILK